MPRIRIDVEGPVVTVRLDNPPLNAFDSALRAELSACARELADARDVRAVVLHGGERLFAAGADIKALAAMGPEEVRGWNRALQRTFDEVARLPMPVVAALTGYALGGGMELALAADYRVAADNAVLGQPEVQLGIMPGSGGTQRLTRLIGPSRAKNLLMTGRRVAADEALRLGLVDEVVPAGSALDAALSYARRLAEDRPRPWRRSRSRWTTAPTSASPPDSPWSGPCSRAFSARRTPRPASAPSSNTAPDKHGSGAPRRGAGL